ncbi:MAG: hypothetical protein Q7J98_08225, partial [Kiritimatiellia bacterium]|nr:hypothetical protein [Kiritimatiellia bacterium]
IKDLGTAFATVEWEGCAESGHPKTFVSLIAKTVPVDGHSSINGGIRITENAVIFPYPSPLLLVMGKYDGFSAELLILEEDHLFGKGTTKISVEDHSVFVAERPVAIDWDFHEKKLTVLIQEATDLVIMGKRTGKLLPGKHVLTDDPNFQRAHELLKKKLADVMRYQKATAKSFSPFFARKPCGLPQEGMASLASQGSAQASPEAPPRRAKMPRGFRLCLSAPPRHVPRGASSGPLSAGPVHSKNSGKQAPEISLDLGDPIREMVGIMHAGDPLIGVAAQNCFYLVTPKGKIISETRTEGAIRKIHCWQEQNLILIGCADEKVIALDTAGKRKWTFISEMAPAVLKMGKTYWFKSATGNGNEGIHGIGSGVFLNGKSQLFIGSACTLEILAEDGNLIKRIPVFFGPGTNIRIIEGPRNSLNLLISRCPADGPSLAVVNNMALDPPAFYEPNLKVTTVSPEHSWHQSTVCPTVHSFGGLPAGHTRITGGFGSMITDHVFVDDINADGAKEVICCVNRTWSRITVYAADGTPLANANFGPGAQNFGVCGFDGKTAGKRIQDVDIAEINGKKVIVAAVSDGTLVGLDQNCQTIWSERLPVPPTVMKAINGADNENAALIVGGEDGGIFTFNTTDAPALIGRVIGKPSCICGIGGSLAMIGTDRGKIRGFRLK